LDPIKPPSDISQLFISDKERAVLAHAFSNPENLSHILSQINSEFFLFAPHRIIFNAMASLLPEVKRIDFNTLRLRCLEFGLNKEIADHDQYLQHVTCGNFEDSALDIHLQAVKDAYIKYRLYLMLGNSSRRVDENKHDGAQMDADALLNYISTEISSLDAFRGLDDEIIDFSERARVFVNEQADLRTDVKGLRTGFDTLDTEINGLMNKTLTAVAARYKVGKSALLSNIADYVAYQSKQCSVLVLSTEMSSDEDLSRVLAIRTLLPERSISNGTSWHEPKEKEKLEAAINQIENSPCRVYHKYIPSFTVESVIATATHERRKIKNLGLVIFDYIKSPTNKDGLSKDSREYQLLGDLTTALKNFAGQEDIPVLTACQLNRENEVADSDRISRYANNVVYLRYQTPKELKERGDFKTYGTHMLEIKTTRAGGSGKIPFRFWESCLKFEIAESFDLIKDTNGQPRLTTPGEITDEMVTKWREHINLPKTKKETGVDYLMSKTEELDTVRNIENQINPTNIAKNS